MICTALLAALLLGCTEHVPIVFDEADPHVVVLAPPEVFEETCARDGGLADVACYGCERWIACVYLGEHHLDGGAAVGLKQPAICQRYWSGPTQWGSEDCALCLSGTECSEFDRWDEAVCEACPDCLSCV